MKKEKKKKHFIQKPSYEGGIDALRAFISRNLIYPKEAIQNNIEGVVKVKFTINHKGNVIEANPIHKLGFGCDEEATRLVKLLKFIVPKNKGVKVLFHKDLNIHFALGNANTSSNPSSMNIQYQFKPKDKQPNKKKEQKGGYHYTVDIGS